MHRHTRFALGVAVVVLVAVALMVAGTRPVRAQRGEKRPKVAQTPLDLPPPTVLVPVEAGALPPGAERADDPERAATDYIAKTRREAEAAVKSLKDEATALRDRLKKVESALNRWETLLSALDLEARPAQQGQELETVVPSQLEPIPAAGTVLSEPAAKPN
jgi:hypothetical protein